MVANFEPDQSDGQTRVRVAVYSTYRPLAQAIQNLLQRSGEVAALDLSQTCPPPNAVVESRADVLVLDVDGSPGGVGELIGQVLRSLRGVRIVAMSANVDRRLVECALDAGATGYLLKDRVFDDVVCAVRAAARNQRYLSPTLEGGDGCERRGEGASECTEPEFKEGAS